MIELAAEVPLPPPRYPGIAYALARYRARRIVESELRSQGIRVSYVPPRDIIAQAMEYLRNHPELLDQATESVRNDPKLRKIAEREERERLRQWRKLARGGAQPRNRLTQIKNPLAPSINNLADMRKTARRRRC